MSEFPDTSDSLIAKIKDRGQADAWSEFERIYRPVIFRIARAKGLQYTDAVDLVQQVMMSVATAIPRYESQVDGPPFRNWLSRITHNAIIKALTRQPRDRAVGGTEPLIALNSVSSDDVELDEMIQLEYRREIFRKAAESVRANVGLATWLAFETTVLQGMSIEAAARKLDLSVGNVYAARSRVINRLRRAVKAIRKNHETS